ncbi:probable WRKY transcription factor 13 [Corylus avellana]|uniref:probable WRKY transcription factor 13 n=1 Tax=Corylus avellana TaxID=13451 RepID=UPI001E20E316|nr:probable WRKY transcription factor 13 [Corylus avellana]XP_059432899.1 probable WRKY transcription factor 13 [Corylus avellana]
MLNQGLFEDQEVSTQMGFFSFPSNLTLPSLGCHQSLKAFTTIPPSLASDAPSSNLTETLLSSATTKQREDTTSDFRGSQLLSLHRSAANLWAWGDVGECLSNKRGGGDLEDHHLGVSTLKMKKIKARRKVREPRFCFKTMSDVDVLDDGYKWRKYGQKVVKNTQHPRSYYRCTQDNCRVKKRVERLAEDPRMVITTYEGRHIHSPSHDMEDSQAPSHLNNFFW